jgi:hypothetical protein
MVACWAGARRRKDPNYINDSAYYVKENIKQLSKLKHNLDQITFIVNKNDDQVYNTYMSNLNGSMIGTAKVEVLFRPNIGMSYAAWEHGYKHSKGKFKYYIINEDDYLPYMDNFDTLLEDIILEKKVDYVCGIYTDHAAFCPGIMLAATLDAIYLRGGNLPSSKTATNYGDTENIGQRGYDKAFTKLGYLVKAYQDKGYLTIFEEANGSFTYYGDKAAPSIIVPVNYLEWSKKQDV